MAAVNLELLQQIIDHWALTSPPEQGQAALKTMAELKIRDEIWRQSDRLLRLLADEYDPDLPF